MTGTIKRTTTHYNMRIPIFDAPGWGREIERNLDIIDAVVFAATNFSLVKGLWTNSTLYNVGDRVVDEDTNTIWECLVQHTSPATGSFVDDRTANPTYWQIVSTIVQNRGVWQPGTTYKYNDFVEFGNKVAVTVVPSYTSGASFDDDVLNNNLYVVIDLDPQVSAASASAGAAAASASAAQTSEINAASSASAASVSAGNASASASAAAGSASAASVSASNAASSASQAASSKSDAEAAKTAAESARDQSQSYRNEALNFRNQAEGFKNDAAASAAAAATFDPANFFTKTQSDNRFVRKDTTATQSLSGPLTVNQSFGVRALPGQNVGIVLADENGNEVALIYAAPSTGFLGIRRKVEGGSYAQLKFLPDSITYNDNTIYHSGHKATADQIRAGTANTILTSDNVWAAAGYVGLSGAAGSSLAAGTYAPNFNAGINFYNVLGGNITIANPTNAKAGQTGLIVLQQDATGGRTVAFGSAWRFANGNAPSINTAAGRTNVIAYQVLHSGFVIGSSIAGLL